MPRTFDDTMHERHAATYTVEPCPTHSDCFVPTFAGSPAMFFSHYATRDAAQSHADALNAERVLTPESYAAVFGPVHCACTDATCPTWQAGFRAGFKAGIEYAERIVRAMP